MDTLLIILAATIYTAIGVIWQIYDYKKDREWKEQYGDWFYTSLLERIIGVIIWPIHMMATIEA